MIMAGDKSASCAILAYRIQRSGALVVHVEIRVDRQVKPEVCYIVDADIAMVAQVENPGESFHETPVNRRDLFEEFGGRDLLAGKLRAPGRGLKAKTGRGSLRRA